MKKLLFLITFLALALIVIGIVYYDFKASKENDLREENIKSVRENNNETIEKKSMEKENDLQKENLKGKVKSVRESNYEAIENFGKIVKGELSDFGHHSKFFNDKGYLIEENYLGYNDVNSTYKYDNKGNLIEAYIYTDGSLSEKKTAKYDEKGNRIEENIYNSEGNLNFKATYKYDKKKNKIEENWYHSDGVLVLKKTYKYDNNEDLIETIQYKSEDSIPEKYTYKYLQYDAQGNWTERVEYENDKPYYINMREIVYY